MTKRERELAAECLPCPFCGGTPEVNMERERVRCINPDCHVQPATNYGIPPAGHMSCWNQRA